MTTYPTGRAKVRDIVAGLLVAGVPAVSGRVYRARTWPLFASDQPSLLVYGYKERKALFGNVGGVDPEYTVTCSIDVQIRAAAEGDATEALEATVEDLAGAIEQAVLTAPELTGWQGAIERINSVETEFQIQADGEKALAGGVVSFEAQWTETFSIAPPDTSPCDTFTTAMQFDPPVP